MAPPPLFQPGKELPLLWEDRHFVVINKPAGLAAHPGPKVQDSVESRLLPQKRGGPWLVHRLDADTAGCLLIARRKSALVAAQKAFATHETIKRYWALVEGHPTRQQGTLTTLLRRVSSIRQGWKMVSDPMPETVHPSQTDQGRLARTSWCVLASDGTSSLLELTLHTGRTHQARVHCAALGTPIIGDGLYGSRHDAGRMRLLARSLEVPVRLVSPPETDRTVPQIASSCRIKATAGDVELERFLQAHAIPARP
ncbi:RNA pseudouridine synthase [Parasaccharibacter sp. TMW 2.1891]|uniref:RluA family pseudouridine synthase n=1 Tax=Parasaccharibacter sp. TMW 2.1891 TaxID=2267836 RepID=UPI0020119A43|nr:RNA pseudouridine synthase [Parasaccharibacter sp. TMW 2.1891]MCL1512770.1 RNA pseudouridine synthase [Parasaccharibacter sp. TMW 2.1891]MCQ0041486.1 RNA pseudouridine synthase [Bombella sp.]